MVCVCVCVCVCVVSVLRMDRKMTDCYLQCYSDAAGKMDPNALSEPWDKAFAGQVCIGGTLPVRSHTAHALPVSQAGARVCLSVSGGGGRRMPRGVAAVPQGFDQGRLHSATALDRIVGHAPRTCPDSDSIQALELSAGYGY